MALEEGSCGLLKGFILWRPWTSIHPFHDKLVCWTDLVGLSFPHVWAKRNVSFMKKYSSNKAFWFRKTNKLITCLFVYLFGRGQILPPSSSELPPEPPTLMAFLNSSSNFTLFRQYALVRNLSLSCQNSSLSFFSQCDLVCVCVCFFTDVQSVRCSVECNWFHPPAANRWCNQAAPQQDQLLPTGRSRWWEPVLPC